MRCTAQSDATCDAQSDATRDAQSDAMRDAQSDVTRDAQSDATRMNRAEPRINVCALNSRNLFQQPIETLRLQSVQHSLFPSDI